MNFILNVPVKYIFGTNTINKIGTEIKNNGLKKVLLLAGGGSIKKNGVYKQVINSLQENNIEYIEVWGVQPNPILSHTKEAIELARASKVDSILAVGGGSVIDEAKAIAAGFYLDDVWDVYAGKVKVNSALPVFTVLTISAAASEINSNSVLTNEFTKQKWSIASPVLFPKVSIVDPSVQNTLPWEQTLNGFVDSMCHITEVYFTDDIEISLQLYEGIMRTLIDSVLKLKKNQQDLDARSNFVYASSMALCAFPRCGANGDWSMHAIEHGISGWLPKIAHGAGLSAIYPAWLMYMNSYNPKNFERWAVNVLGAKNFEEGLQKFVELLKDLGAPYSIKQLDVSESDIEPICDLILQAGKPGRLKILEKEDLMLLLKNSLQS